jgi:hypothetical protein
VLVATGQPALSDDAKDVGVGAWDGITARQGADDCQRPDASVSDEFDDHVCDGLTVAVGQERKVHSAQVWQQAPGRSKRSAASASSRNSATHCAELPDPLGPPCRGGRQPGQGRHARECVASLSAFTDLTARTAYLLAELTPC